MGAGDCFQAGLLSALHREDLLSIDGMMAASIEDMEMVLRWASATAAINVTRKGCNPPTGEEVKRFLDQQPAD